MRLPGGSSPWIVVAVAAIAVAAFYAGRGSGAAPAAAPAPAAVSGVPVSPAGAAATRTAVGGSARLDPALRDAIRDAVRDELTEALAERDEAAGEAKAAKADEEPTAENIAALDGAHTLVSAAIGTGHWTQENANALRGVMQKMTGKQREEILSTLFPAINRGEIKPDFAGPLF